MCSRHERTPVSAGCSRQRTASSRWSIQPAGYFPPQSINTDQKRSFGNPLMGNGIARRRCKWRPSPICRRISRCIQRNKNRNGSNRTNKPKGTKEKKSRRKETEKRRGKRNKRKTVTGALSVVVCTFLC